MSNALISRSAVMPSTWHDCSLSKTFKVPKNGVRTFSVSSSRSFASPCLVARVRERAGAGPGRGEGQQMLAHLKRLGHA